MNDINKKIRVGIIGVNPERGWASWAHIPALRSLPDFEVTALSASTQQKADAAGEALNIKYRFDNTEDLVNCPEVDLVVITVKTPQHKELVTAAVNAGKNVYCEWPVGNGLNETIELEELARKKGVKAFSGIQAQSVPAVNYIKDLISEGYIGEILSTSMIASGGFPELDQANAYLLDKKNGANMLTIAVGSTLQAVTYALGQVSELQAVTATRQKTFTISDTREVVPVNTADQVAVIGKLRGGSVVSVHFRFGSYRGTNMLWEVNGTKGDLKMTGDGGHVSFFPLRIYGGTGEDKEMRELMVPGKYTWVNNALEWPAFVVAQHYARLASDLSGNTHFCTTFEDAVKLQRLLAAIESSAETGTAIKL
jgi:predicted dehydrogenase